jgi:hypothetical protein
MSAVSTWKTAWNAANRVLCSVGVTNHGSVVSLASGVCPCRQLGLRRYVVSDVIRRRVRHVNVGRNGAARSFVRTERVRRCNDSRTAHVKTRSSFGAFRTSDVETSCSMGAKKAIRADVSSRTPAECAIPALGIGTPPSQGLNELYVPPHAALSLRPTVIR